MTMFTLGPDEGEDEIDDEGGEVDTTATDDEAGESGELSEIDRLRAELDAQRTINAQQIEDLRRTVGRVQSVAAKADTVSKADLQKSLNEGFGSVHELLASIVDAADPTVFPDTLKSQMAKALADAQRRADRDSLRDEILNELPKVVEPEYTELQPHQRAEALTLQELKASDLTPDDLDWKAADAEWLKGGEGALLANVRAQIAAIKAEEDTSVRRQARKTAAPKVPKGGAGGGAKTDAEVFLDPKAPFEERMKVFRKMVG